MAMSKNSSEAGAGSDSWAYRLVFLLAHLGKPSDAEKVPHHHLEKAKVSTDILYNVAVRLYTVSNIEGSLKLQATPSDIELHNVNLFVLSEQTLLNHIKVYDQGDAFWHTPGRDLAAHRPGGGR